MKTTELIPIILYQLVDGDKYGYEIVKQIEDSSNGGIVIKQPTLYSVLKKLEQGRFISSYWQDSEIGGKRHYYKLTENGKLQVSTLPSYKELLTNLLEEDVDINEYVKKKKRAFGEGDTYLAAAVGALLGWKYVLIVICLAVVLQALCIFPQFFVNLYLIG